MLLKIRYFTKYCIKQMMILYSTRVFKVSEMDDFGNDVLQNYCKIS